MKKYLRKFVLNFIPLKNQLFFRYSYKYITKKLDQEMLLVNKLLKRKNRFLDIGCNVGIYSYYFSRKFKYIESFEPIDHVTESLKSLNLKGNTIHNVALSEINDTQELYVPIINGFPESNLASLIKPKKPFEVNKINVRILDDYNFDDVDLIKIDVEGLESKVIKGSLKTISKTLPILLIEIEQRHLEFSIDKVFKLIKSIEYDGFFLFNNKLSSIDNFNYYEHQEPYLKNVLSKKYINNFIFLPKNYM